MVTTLRVVLDQVVAPTDPDLATASREMARALILSQPSGCQVEAIVPGAKSGAKDAVSTAVEGLGSVHAMALPRREMAAAWQLGMPSGVGAGMIHSPTLMAPLVRHDRVHAHDQTVVTLWDLRAWEAPEELPRSAVSWHKAMLKRAVKHADAIVVPTHRMADRLSELATMRGRLRVIAGAAPAGFCVPRDEVGRRRELDLPEGFVLVAGGAAPSHALSTAFAAVAASGIDAPIVVIDARQGEEPAIADAASAAGIPERLLHVRGTMEEADRGAVFGAAVALVAPSRRTVFPWRVVEALALGVPVVATDSPVHRDVLLDGGTLAGESGAWGSGDSEQDASALGASLAETLDSAATVEKASVLSADRGRAFSWHEAAERVWQLHADL